MPSKKFKNLIPSKLMGKGVETGPASEDITAVMRKNADIIMNTLKATDIENSNLSDEIKNKDKESFGVCEEEIFRQEIIKSLENSPIISDDLTKIDAQIIRLAKIYKEAAELGQNTAFHWAGNALKDAIDLRKNLPEVASENRDKEITARCEKVNDWNTLVTIACALDDALAKKETFDASYRKYSSEFEAEKLSLREYISTDGAVYKTELDNNPTKANGLWSKGAKELNERYNTALRLRSDMLTASTQYDVAVQEYNKYSTEFDAIRVKIRSMPSIYREQLDSEFKTVLDDIAKNVEESVIRSAEIEKQNQNYILRVQTIMSESDAAKQLAEKRNILDDEMERDTLRERGKIVINDYSHLAPVKQEEVIQNINEQRVLNSND